MPTNILRKRGTGISAKDAPKPSKSGSRRRIEVAIGAVVFTATLKQTVAADRIWNALPLFSTAETWGSAIHFEVPVESGREPGAVIKGQPGDFYFWSDEHRVMLVFGPTPLSRPGEMRLPVPCNVWAATTSDLSSLRQVTPGERVSLRAIL